MGFDQQLDTVGKADLGFDGNLIEHAAAEQPKAVAGIARRNPCDVIHEERRRSHQHGLQRRATFHPPARHEPRSRDDVVPSRCFSINVGNPRSVVVVVSGKRHHARGIGAGKAGEHRAKRAAPDGCARTPAATDADRSLSAQQAYCLHRSRSRSTLGSADRSTLSDSSTLRMLGPSLKTGMMMSAANRLLMARARRGSWQIVRWGSGGRRPGRAVLAPSVRRQGSASWPRPR